MPQFSPFVFGERVRESKRLSRADVEVVMNLTNRKSRMIKCMSYTIIGC